ncbi:hypothetical protein ACH5RR_018145 [Cinchona calisaya]|uniref:Uncharacterized protein n=1 Tax=Cinchona calisaya TaxID=153742 RepID=A0ABD2ZKL3_9GENT
MRSSSKHTKHELYVKRTFDSKYPCFIASLHSPGLLHDHTVYIPTTLSRTYLQDCPDSIGIQDFGNKDWSVNTIVKNVKVVSRLVDGRKLSMITNLHQEICVFERIQTSNLVLKLTIFGADNLVNGASN